MLKDAKILVHCCIFITYGWGDNSHYDNVVIAIYLDLAGLECS